MKSDNWFIKIRTSAKINGKWKRWTRTDPYIFPAMKVSCWLQKHLPPEFRGRDIHVTTPIHHDIYVVSETPPFLVSNHLPNHEIRCKLI
jgi:hypothetical protein